jgi:hypothetical protein
MVGHEASCERSSEGSGPDRKGLVVQCYVRHRTELASQVLAPVGLAPAISRRYICSVRAQSTVRTARSAKPVPLVRQTDHSSDPSARLARGVGIVLHHALEARQRGVDDRDAVRRSARSLCRIARRQGILVEHLILMCKDTWRALPDAQVLPRSVANDMLARVIAQCIEEYYRTDGEDLPRVRRSADALLVPETSLSFMFGPLS